MLHLSRGYQIHSIESVEELAEKLSTKTWSLCTGFRIGDYFFLNDSPHEDAPQQYAIVKIPCFRGGPYLQVESIDFSRWGVKRSATLIRQALSGKFDLKAEQYWNLFLETVSDHETCHHCA